MHNVVMLICESCKDEPDVLDLINEADEKGVIIKVVEDENQYKIEYMTNTAWNEFENDYCDFIDEE